MNGEAVTLPEDRENQPYQSLRRGEQHVAPGVAGAPAATRQSRYAARVNKRQPRQVNDDPRLARRESFQGVRHVCGVKNVKLPAQRDDGVSAAFTRPQVHVEHYSAFLHRTKAESRPSG
jgi:hypothetical protein